jgi:hypothetical protein
MAARVHCLLKRRKKPPTRERQSSVHASARSTADLMHPEAVLGEVAHRAPGTRDRLQGATLGQVARPGTGPAPSHGHIDLL